jgi:hypothetical protein
VTLVFNQKESFAYRIKTATFQTIGKKTGYSGEIFV